MTDTQAFENLSKANQDFQILEDGKMAVFDTKPVLYEQEGRLYLDQEDLTAVEADQPILSLVVDIGSTTVAACLVDNREAVELASQSGLNPQREYGDDVISRTTFVIEREDGLDILQDLILDQIKSLARSLLEDSGYDFEDLYAIFIASNAIMNHILLGISPVPLGRSPYKLQFKGKGYLDFSEAGFEDFGVGKIVAIPNISAFVGGDITAGIISTEIYQTEDTELFIDIGTNGELILNHDGQLYSTSCAAGPALEGMGIACGVTAQAGAIEEASFEDGKLTLQNINQKASVGICGSGILAIIREFLKAGLINRRGNIEKQDKVDLSLHHFYLDDQKALWVDKDAGIYISQKDIRQIQMAKGAILTGVECLLNFAGVTEDQVDTVYIAGQFGSYLSPESLVEVGLLPTSFFDKIAYVGNTSKSGCFMLSLNRDLYQEVDDMVTNIKHLPLSIVEDFDKILAKSTLFPKAK